MLITGWIFALLATSVGIAGSYSAYRNGINDGAGCLNEPDCPGYSKAGKYLRRYKPEFIPQVTIGQTGPYQLVRMHPTKLRELISDSTLKKT